MTSHSGISNNGVISRWKKFSTYIYVQQIDLLHPVSYIFPLSHRSWQERKLNILYKHPHFIHAHYSTLHFYIDSFLPTSVNGTVKGAECFLLGFGSSCFVSSFVNCAALKFLVLILL